MSQLQIFILITSLLATCSASSRKHGPQPAPSPQPSPVPGPLPSPVPQTAPVPGPGPSPVPGSGPGVVSTAVGDGSSLAFGVGGQTQNAGTITTQATKAPAGGFALANVLSGALSQSQGITTGRVTSTTGVANQTPGSLSTAGGDSQVEFFGVKNTYATAITTNSGVANQNGGWNEIQGASTASGDSIIRSGMAFNSYSEGR